jgi:hypothetical protein
MIYYILFGILVIIFIISIVLSGKLFGLRRLRLTSCNPVNIIDEYNEDINDISISNKSVKPKKIKFDDTVKVRVFG